MIQIPDEVKFQVLGAGNEISAKGPHGEIHKKFHATVKLKIHGKEISVEANSKEMINTVEALLSNMVDGAKNVYKRNFKLIYAHFPISIELKGKDIVIKNFLGEKQVRRAALVGTTKLEAKGQSITISGADKESVGQTIANMRSAMKIKDKDGRVFQDGMYDVEGEN